MPDAAPHRRLRVFRSLGLLTTLNVLAVGLALAAVTAAVSRLLNGDEQMAVATGAPTFVLGTIWAAMLRWPRTIGRTSFRMGWAASMPLAMTNSAAAAALAFGHSGGYFAPAIAGATIGAVVWLPALMLTLLCFGVPIAWAQKLAAKGLAGAERGEWIVGLACTAMSMIALALASQVGRDVTVVALGALGLATGLASTVLAFLREHRRRRFVADAAAGRLAGYRVDATDEGKVLVRVEARGAGYRVADFEEEIFELNADGTAMRARRIIEPSL